MLARATLLAVLMGLSLLGSLSTAVAGDGDRHKDAIVVISGDVNVHRHEVVDGVFIASGDARVAGRVEGDVVVLSGDVLLSGKVEGDVFTAAGTARLLSSAEVTGDVRYADNHPDLSAGTRVRGDVEHQGLPDIGGWLPIVGGFVVWLAISLSLLVLGLLALLLAPRAADSIYARAGERTGPVIAIGIAIFICLPLTALLAGVTILGLPLALLIVLALLPVGALGYIASAWALGRRVLRPPRERLLAFMVGLVILRAIALLPVLGLLAGLAAAVFGLGLIGAAIGAARKPEEMDPAEAPAA